MKIAAALMAALIAALLLAYGCSSPDEEAVTLEPGSYLTLGKNEKATLVVVRQDQTAVTVSGTYKNLTGIPNVLGQMTPSSVSGAYSVATDSCGTFEFTRSKGTLLVCTSCKLGTPLRVEPDCSFNNMHMAIDWIARDP